MSFAPKPSPAREHRPFPHRPKPGPYSMYHPEQGQVTPYQKHSTPQSNPPYSPPHQTPHPNSDTSFGNGYSSDPEPHRRKHQSRTRRISENSRPIYADSLIGAAGGGLIGGLLFPGLGTVGGALVGWVGGMDYGEHRKWREEKRERDQEKWERKYGSDRSKSHSREGQKSSHDRQKNHD